MQHYHQNRIMFEKTGADCPVISLWFVAQKVASLAEAVLVNLKGFYMKLSLDKSCFESTT